MSERLREYRFHFAFSIVYGTAARAGVWSGNNAGLTWVLVPEEPIPGPRAIRPEPSDRTKGSFIGHLLTETPNTTKLVVFGVSETETIFTFGSGR